MVDAVYAPEPRDVVRLAVHPVGTEVGDDDGERDREPERQRVRTPREVRRQEDGDGDHHRLRARVDRAGEAEVEAVAQPLLQRWLPLLFERNDPLERDQDGDGREQLQERNEAEFCSVKIAQAAVAPFAARSSG